MVFEEQDERLVIDPGELTILPELSQVAALVFTHVHGDHFSLDAVRYLLKHSPNMRVYAAPEVAEKLRAEGIPVQEITTDCTEIAGAFTLEIRCIDHAVVYETSPCKNLTVVINEQVYHPGDSFVEPPKPVDVCLVPLAAPWSKAAEVMAFIGAAQAKQYVPIHDAVLSDAGKGFYNYWAGSAAEAKNRTYSVLKTGESIQV